MVLICCLFWSLWCNTSNITVSKLSLWNPRVHNQESCAISHPLVVHYGSFLHALKTIKVWRCIYSFLLAVLGIELRLLHCSRKILYHLIHNSIPLLFVIQIGSCSFAGTGHEPYSYFCILRINFCSEYYRDKKSPYPATATLTWMLIWSNVYE
jgi:hypothetical protein